MKKLLKEYWGLFLILILIDSFIIISLFIRVKYDVTAPASIDKVSNVIRIDDDEDSNVNTVSVYSYSKVNLLDYFVALINPYAEISETYEYAVTDYASMYSSGVIQKRVSIYNAIISAYKKAGYDNIVDTSSFKGYIIHTLYSYSPSELKIGDIITSFNGYNFKGFTEKNEFAESISGLEYDKSQKYSITVLRDGKELTLEIAPHAYIIKEDVKYASFGIATYEYIIPSNSDGMPKYSWNYGYSIGPSGGLMQSLHIYDELTGGRLTRNFKIVGTGTVDVYGNAGPIGGIYQKVITAHLSKADLFIIPVSSMNEEVYKLESNYKEAMRAYQTLDDTDMDIIVASSLDDIIKYLESK